MPQASRTARGSRHWTGRILPVLCVALLAIGAVHAKDKKKSTVEAVAGQVEAVKKPEPARRVAAETRSEPPKREDAPRREDPPKKADPPSRDDPPKSSSSAISKDRIIQQAEKRHQARVVRADPGESNGRRVYSLRLLSNTDVWVIVVDAETGKELK